MTPCHGRFVFRLPVPVLCIMLCLIFLSEASGRTWTTKAGRTYEGLLSGVVGDVAEIDSNGRIIKIPIRDLIESDQRYIENLEAQVSGAGRQPSGSGSSGTTATSGNAASSNTVTLESRTWTDSQGRTITGRFGGVKNDQVTIVGNGTSTVVAVDKLSPGDQIYLRRVRDRLDPAQHGRYWSLTDGRQVKGSVVQAQGAEIWILTSLTDDRFEVATLQLSDNDQKYVCSALDQRTSPPALDDATYRTWNNTQEGWSMVGRLKDFKQEVAVVEQEHREYFLKLPSLASTDQDYVRKYFPDKRRSASSDDDTEGKYTDGGWSVGGWNLGAIAMSVFAVSVLALISAISLKYVRESFEGND